MQWNCGIKHGLENPSLNETLARRVILSKCLFYYENVLLGITTGFFDRHGGGETYFSGAYHITKRFSFLNTCLKKW